MEYNVIYNTDCVTGMSKYISNEAVDAYEKGVLPINTLANAVLRKYDEQQKAVAENYEQEVSQDNTVERSRGLK